MSYSGLAGGKSRFYKAGYCFISALLLNNGFFCKTLACLVAGCFSLNSATALEISSDWKNLVSVRSGDSDEKYWDFT